MSRNGETGLLGGSGLEGIVVVRAAVTELATGDASVGEMECGNDTVEDLSLKDYQLSSNRQNNVLSNSSNGGS